MAPVFSTTRKAAGFLALLLGALLLPVVLRMGGSAGRDRVYDSVPSEAGPFSFVAKQIFYEGSDIDLLILGDSLLWVGVDALHVQRELSRALGREAHVVVIAANWAGTDLRYMLLRDLLEHRKVRMLLLSLPTSVDLSDRPHVQAFRWLRYGDVPEVMSLLPTRDRAAVFSANVLGAPRQLLALTRPDRSTDADDVSLNLGAKLVRKGYRGAQFFEQPIASPALAARQVLYSKDTKDRWRFEGPKLGSYHGAFLRSTGDLIRKHNIVTAVVHVPVDTERGQTVVQQRLYAPDALGIDALMIGVP
jgi:hypothetical protein